MQVSVEKTEGLERKLTVDVPAERLDTAIEKKLRSLARTMRVDGFRPGKVPMRVIKRQYGSIVREEVLTEMISETLDEAVRDQNLMVAGNLSITERGDVEGGFRYVASFEVFPEIESIDYSAIEIKRPQATVGDEDVEQMIDKLRSQRATWSVVERASADKDRLTIDFVGKIDGEAFTGGSADDFQLVLGSSQMIHGFEEALAGAAAGEKREFDVDFPEDYRAEHLAGKKARFEVEVKQVEEQTLPQLDDEFAASMQIADGGVEGLRMEVRSNMERELRRALRGALKENVMDALLASNPVSAPKALVEEEMKSLAENSARQSGQAGNFNLPSELFREKAERRVTLGLLLRDIVTREEIKGDPARVRERVEEIASTYEDPDSVIDWYYNNRDYLANVEGEVIEDQVVDLIVGQARVSDVESSFGDLVGSNH
jgi:trigger factor